MDRSTARLLMESLNLDAQRIAARFGLRYRKIEAERGNVTSRYGICYSDGLIKIRLIHATTGRPLKYSSLVNTLCHELAHLRHFDHGLRFRAFYQELLAWARAEGIYRPGRPALTQASAAASAPRRRGRGPVPVESGPRQLVLFGSQG